MITSFLVHVHTVIFVCVESLRGKNFHKFRHIPALISEKFITQFFVLYVLVIIHVPIEYDNLDHIGKKCFAPSFFEILSSKNFHI